MKYRKIILILLGSLLFIVLWYLTIDCASKSTARKERLRTFASGETVAVFTYDFIIIENTRYRNNEEFKVFVEEQVKGTGYLKICYDPVVRLHKTYLIRAWVFYKKANKNSTKLSTPTFSQMRLRPAEDAGKERAAW